VDLEQSGEESVYRVRYRGEDESDEEAEDFVGHKGEFFVVGVKCRLGGVGGTWI
jgi:hypothetical protein